MTRQRRVTHRPIAPMPIRTPYVHGEAMWSYAKRLSARNHLTVQEVLRATTGNGQQFFFTDEHREIWRQLGGLYFTAFANEPAAGTIASRNPELLCLRCSKGEELRGWTRDLGPICIRHRLWVQGPEQLSIHALPEMVQAEKRFRRHLSPHGVRYPEHSLMAAAVRITESVSPYSEVLRDRRQRLPRASRSLPDSALWFPEQVQLARYFGGNDYLTTLNMTVRWHKIGHRYEVIKAGLERRLSHLPRGLDLVRLVATAMLHEARGHGQHPWRGVLTGTKKKIHWQHRY